MIQIIAQRSLRSWKVAILAIFAGLLLTPRASEASCGDYVHVNGRPAMAAHSMSDHPPGDSTQQTADHRTPRRPCHGPGCSERPLPPVAPVPHVVGSAEQWALASCDIAANPVCCNSLLAEPHDLVAAGFRLSILRPPR